MRRITISKIHDILLADVVVKVCIVFTLKAYIESVVVT